MATRKYSTFVKAPPKKGYAPGDVLKLGPNQVAHFAEGLGYYAAPKAKKPTTRVVKTATTPQGSFTTIETPAQIEERVKRMASASFTEQQKILNDQAERLRKEAEGRRLGLQAAYQAAAQANAGMGVDVQDGWEQAARTITGLAGTATGGVKDALLADLATQEQALSRVGAGGTGFDATSQGDVEYFRGGGIPGEYDTRMGGVGRQWMNEAAQALNTRGLQEGIAAENKDRGTINSDLADQIAKLTAGRSEYESTLREQLLGAQSDQIKAAQDQREFEMGLSLKKVQIEQAQQKIDLQYQEARAKAVTTADKFKLDQWYKQQNLILSQARNDIAQQRVGIAQQNADTATTRANTAAATSKTGGSPATKRMAISNADKAGKTALATEITRLSSKIPGITAPVGTDPKEYKLSKEYAAAAAKAREVVRLNFGSLMYRVIVSIGPYLKEIGYTPTQIKRTAYNIASAKVEAPRSWLQSNPGFGPKV